VSPWELKIHFIDKHSDKDDPRRTQHKCGDCGEGFSRPGTRDVHYIVHHTDAADPRRLAHRKRVNTYIRWRYATDEEYRIVVLVRAAVRRILDLCDLGKIEVTEKYLNCTYLEFVAHLNKNDRGFVFGDDITFGKLNIDHIRPIANFNMLCYVEVFKACNFKNTQLLPWKENNDKGAKFPPEAAVAYAASENGKAIEALVPGWIEAKVCKRVGCVCGCN
jgi:hypothetical protein